MRRLPASLSVDGIKPVPTQVLATADWQGMKITAEATTAVPFVIFNGTSEQMVKPARNTSFHLMVMLNDAQTGVAIPYATVWATISKAGKIVFDERQWPMISRYMGPHYGNDVHCRAQAPTSSPCSSARRSPPATWSTQTSGSSPTGSSFTFHWKPIA